MTSRTRLMAIYFGLAVWFWSTAVAFAQARQASPLPEDASRPDVAQRSNGNYWDTVVWDERRYKIEAVRFKARRETGIGWLGSDEVMIGTVDAKGQTVSDEIKNIDSGKTHSFDPAKSCIVAVRPGVVVLGKTSVCDNVGEAAPLSFQVEFWEKDPIGHPPGFCGTNPPGPGRHAGPHCLDDHNGDDFIGRAWIDLAAQELEAALPKVGDEYTETIVLFPCQEDVCGGQRFPDYTFTYRITRLPDMRVSLRSLLDEAMCRSGARYEIEAIAAGLRSLRAPNSRRIELDTVNLPPKR
jgi:hypothetical protein